MTPAFSLLPLVVKLMATVIGPAVGSLTPYATDEATLLFAGDAMQHKAQLEAAVRQHGYDYSECFRLVKPYISAADYAVVNLETTLGGRNYTGYPCFCSPDSYAEALADAGFDLLLTANNHTLDRLDRGHARTLLVLDSLEIDHIGTWRDSAERSRRLPFIRDIKGFKIAFLNYTYGTNGLSLKGSGVVDYIDRDIMSADITEARQAGAELIVAAVHWGVEYKLLPHPSQKALSAYLRHQGVDMIIGGHPHVIQPIELSQPDSTRRRTLTVYSLGNFISAMRTTDTRGGAVVRVHLRRDSLGKAIVHSADYSLVYTVPPIQGQNNFMLFPVDSDIIPQQWQQRAQAFAASARRIFAAHNIGVSESAAQ